MTFSFGRIEGVHAVGNRAELQRWLCRNPIGFPIIVVRNHYARTLQRAPCSISTRPRTTAICFIWANLTNCMDFIFDVGVLTAQTPACAFKKGIPACFVQSQSWAPHCLPAPSLRRALPRLKLHLPARRSRPSPSSWWDTFSIGGHVEGAVADNSRAPSDGINFGQLFGDRANTAVLNQAMLTVQRPIDPKADCLRLRLQVPGHVRH